MPRLWGQKGIANHCGVTTRTVQNWIKRGAPIRKTGGRYWANPDHIDAWEIPVKRRNNTKTDG